MASRKSDPLHFLLVPLMSQSHLIPFIDLAKILAHHGLLVTVVITPRNAERYSDVIDYAKSSNLKIELFSIPFPSKEVGLPEGCETMDSLPSPNHNGSFFRASNMLQGPVENWIEKSDPKPNCVISDVCLTWTVDVAGKFNIPRVVYEGISCFTILCSYRVKHSKILETLQSETEPFVVPDLPDKIEFTKSQLPDPLRIYSEETRKQLERLEAAELTADGALVNSFQELEPNYVHGYGKVVKNIWCVGPVSLYTPATTNNDHDCLTWLDSKAQKSVVYICFGSFCKVHPTQLIELSLGLEASNCSFVWILKAQGAEELKNWFVEEKYEERIKGRGLIFRGWAPQVPILSHQAIGAFITHCGWNSILEGVSAGVPFITWPMYAEQFFNEKLIVEVVKTGVRVGVDAPSHWGEEPKTGALVRKENVKKAIEVLMGGGDGGKEIRERAKDLGREARMVVEEGASSHSNLINFIEYVRGKKEDRVECI